MKYFITMIVTLLLAAGAIFAQGMGGAGATNSNTILLKTDQGLFALRAGVVVKNDATTLKQIAELSLFGPVPTAPADMSDRAAMQPYRTEMAKRQAPALMFATKDSLIIIIGDGFWSVNQGTLKADLTVSLLDTTAPAAVVDPNAPPARPAVEPVPGYILDGTTLYLMRGKEELSISITDGKVIARQPLPIELQPAPNPNFRGGRGGGGGGGGAAGG